MKSIKDTSILLTLVMMPALFLGVYTMKWHEVPQSMWILNVAFVFGSIFWGLLFLRFRKRVSAINTYLLIVVAFLLLFTTFLSKTVLDVHRWVYIGGISLNIGLIVGPLLIIQIYNLDSVKNAAIVGLLATIIFLLQPDASLVMAFSVSSAMIIGRKLNNSNYKIIMVIFITTFVFIAWYNLDNIPAIDYVEEIVQLANKISFTFKLFAILSLVILSCPFFLYHKETLSMALGTYYTLLLIAAIFGNFPVMIMGYGISPIIGYNIGLFRLIAQMQDNKQI